MDCNIVAMQWAKQQFIFLTQEHLELLDCIGLQFNPFTPKLKKYILPTF